MCIYMLSSKMWISCPYMGKLTRFEKGEVPVYHVEGVPDIFTQVGRPSEEMQEIWLSEKYYLCAHAYVCEIVIIFNHLRDII